MKQPAILLIILWFIIPLISFAQHNVSLDSLHKQLITQKGLERIKTLDELSWQLRKQKDSLGIRYALEALKLSRNENYYKGLSDAYSRLGDFAKRQDYLEQAKKYYLKALTIDQEQHYVYGIARANNQLGLLYQKQEQRIKALEYFLPSLTAFVSIKSYKQATKVTTNIGKLYSFYNANKEALEYYLKALDYSKLEGNTLLIAKAHKNLGHINKAQENYKETLYHYKVAEKLYLEKKNIKDIADIQIDIATIYDYLGRNSESKTAFIKALNYIKKHKEGNKGALHNNFAALYRKLKQSDSAILHYQKGVFYFKMKHQNKKLSIAYGNMGNVYYDKQEFKTALSYLNKSLNIQQRISSNDFSVLEKTYRSIAKVYIGLKNDARAYAYLDSSFNISKKEFKKIKTGDRYEVAYLNEKNETEALKSQNKIIEVEADKKSQSIKWLILALVLLTVLFFYVTKARQQKQKRIVAEANLKQQKLIATHEKEQQEQQLYKLVKAQEMKAINAMIDGQEEERKRIAQDLHDNLGSKLSLVKIHYKSVEADLETIDKETKEQYEKASVLLDEACKSVREISHNMLSGTLSNFGLLPALKELKQTLENAYKKHNLKNININLTFHKLENRLENTTEIQLYRILQELLNNIIKHAEATEVDIQLLKLEKRISIVVEDNGIGFDMNKDYKGMGLTTIQSRIVKLKGNYNIDSGKGNGTTVTIDIPNYQIEI